MRHACLRIAVLLFTAAPLLFPPMGHAAGKGRGKKPSNDDSSLQTLVAEINEEAEKDPLDSGGLPLPFAAHWNRGLMRNSFAVGEVVDLIKDGHHLLPWGPMPWPGLAPKQTVYQVRSHELGFKELARLGLPVTLISTQWEDHLCLRSDDWLTPPDIETPCLIDLDGNRQRRVSEVGPVAAWYELGRRLVTDVAMLELFAWYPDPPLVIFLSNNESSKANKEEDLRWHDGRLTDAGWSQRYQALFRGMRDNLPPEWSDDLKFVGFNINPAVHFLGRWHGWAAWGTPFANYGLGTWDGGSSEYYLYSNGYSDFRTFSPQLEAMHYVAGLEHVTYPADPNWWMELSVWDGDDYIRDWYEQMGQEMTPERWGGTVQYGLWLVRPRVVREFRDSLTRYREILPYFDPIMAAIDRVWDNTDLRRFWRHGRLVPSEDEHPYQAGVPNPFPYDRFFLLESDLQGPLGLWDTIPVYSLALVLGEAPNREWLIYAHSPIEDRVNVGVTLPGYGAVVLDEVPVGGTFYVIREQTGVAASIAP